MRREKVGWVGLEGVGRLNDEVDVAGEGREVERELFSFFEGGRVPKEKSGSFRLVLEVDPQFTSRYRGWGMRF